MGHQRFPIGTPTPETPLSPVIGAMPERPKTLEMPAVVAPTPTPAPPPVDLAERQDRAKVVYAGLALLAVVLAALLAWRLLKP